MPMKIVDDVDDRYDVDNVKDNEFDGSREG